MLVVKAQYWNHPSGVFLIGHEFGPTFFAHGYSVYEPTSPVVAKADAGLVLQQDRQIHVLFVQSCGNRVPVPHHQPQDIVG